MAQTRTSHRPPSSNSSTKSFYREMPHISTPSLLTAEQKQLLTTGRNARLSIKDAYIDLPAAHDLASVLEHHGIKLKQVYITGCNIVDMTASVILDSLANHASLEILDCHSTRLGKEAATCLANIIRSNPQLRVLNLADCQLSAEAICTLAKAIEGHPNLTTVNVANNRLTHAASSALFTALATARIIRTVNASGCQIPSSATEAVDHFISSAAMLRELDITGHMLDSDDIDSLNKSNPASTHASMTLSATNKVTYSLTTNNSDSNELTATQLTS